MSHIKHVAQKQPTNSNSSSEEGDQENKNKSINGENNLNCERRSLNTIKMPSQSTPKEAPKFLTKVEFIVESL